MAMARKKKPVSIWGIEFDALIDSTKNMTATIPTYPVEDGFPVSDTIINDPISVSLTLYVSNTPVTWLYRHGTSSDRVKKICDMIEQKWLEKQLTKIVTADAIYTSMGITSISIKQSKETGYAREISISAQKVRVTSKKTVEIPAYVLKSGQSMANAGKAETSTASGQAGATAATASSSSSKSSSSSTEKTQAKKKQSILYGAATGLKLI